jgi:DNA-directed RNA polymerase subunit omega
MADSKIVDFPSAAAGAGEASTSQTSRPDLPAMRIHLVEKASEIVPDTPLLINMVSKRVRQLNNGRSPLIPLIERLGAADIALTEIIEGKIVLEEEVSSD